MYESIKAIKCIMGSKKCIYFLNDVGTYHYTPRLKIYCIISLIVVATLNLQSSLWLLNHLSHFDTYRSLYVINILLCNDRPTN